MHITATEGAPGQPKAMICPFPSARRFCGKHCPSQQKGASAYRRHREITPHETAREDGVVCFRLIGGVLSKLLLHKLANTCLSERI